MSKTAYPKEVTEENLPILVKRAKKIKRNSSVLIWLTAVLYFITGSIAMPFLFFFAGSYVSNTFPHMPDNVFSISVLVVFVIILELFLFLLIGLIELGIKRLLKLEYAEVVFADCILITDYLERNDKKKAIREVDGFISALWMLKRERGNLYDSEIRTLGSGKHQIKRMLLFSEGKVSELFTNFGLALVNKNDTMAYRFLKVIIYETERYGKLEGRLQRVQSQVSNLKDILLVLSIVITIIATLLPILPKIFG